LPLFLFAFLFVLLADCHRTICPSFVISHLFADCQDPIIPFSSCSSCLRTVRPLFSSIYRDFRVFLTNKGLSVRQHDQNRGFVTNSGLSVRQPRFPPHKAELRNTNVPLFRSDVMAWRACFACFFMLSVELPFIDLAMTCVSSI
jgi:hypothetical protein